jgi:hypothetical protein
MHRNTWKGALLVCGEPGTGKSRWIREEAAAMRARLFRWNTRVDRSLREGREILHQQVRSKEPLVVWIEGADDLTQEAQAFLRRILETASPNVVCALETRELWKMSPPVLSRCTIVSMKSDKSFRLQQNIQKAITFGILKQNTFPKLNSWRDIPAARMSGYDPHHLIELHAISADNEINPDGIEALRAIGSGSSPWIQLALYLMRSERKGEGGK